MDLSKLEKKKEIGSLSFEVIKKEDAGWNVRGESVIRSLRGIRGETIRKSCWICSDHVNTVGYGARRCFVE